MAIVEQQSPGAAGAGETIPVENPATGEVIRHVPVTSAAEVEAMVEHARAAQRGWEALGYAGRGRILRRAQRWVLDNSERVIGTIVSETGKVYEDAAISELGYTASAFGFWAKNAPQFLADERVRSASPFVAGRKLTVRYRPSGVVGVIGPWNYPLINSFGDAVPAMAAGNAVILKPSEITPLTSLLMAECMRECGLPEGVYQVATGYGETGAALVDAVDMVMFTGSTATGRKVMERAARTLTPVSLELGGKDAMVVLADADLERAANAAVHYSMSNAGQTCIAIERVYVEAPVYDDFVGRVTEKVRALRAGAPQGPGTVDVGAITSPAQVDIIDRHVREAEAAGARVLAGGHRGEGAGHYFEPTVLVDVDHSMSAVREETFGPTLPIMRVASAQEGVQKANDSIFGLGASVWTKDVAKGEALARQIEAGAVCVNDALLNYFALELPMGGWKQSGLGVRHGAAGIRKYTRQQAILVTRFAPLKKDVHMMGYRRSTTRLVGRMLKFVYGRGRRD